MPRALLLVLLALSLTTTVTAGDGERLPLWSAQAPIGDGVSEPAPADATITLHRAAKTNGAALVICPGGGYGGRVSGGEGHGIAAWLNRHGITGVVLDYRLPKGRPAVPLLDASAPSAWYAPTPRPGASIRDESASSASRLAAISPPAPPPSATPARSRLRIRSSGCRAAPTSPS